MPTVFVDEVVLPQSFVVEWDVIPDGPHVAIEFTSGATPGVVVESVQLRRRPGGAVGSGKRLQACVTGTGEGAGDTGSWHAREDGNT